MYLRVIILSFLPLLLIACHNSGDNHQQQEIKNDSLVKIDSSIQVLSFRKEYDTDLSSYDPSTSAISLKNYNKWQLSKNDIVRILKSGRSISTTDLDYNYLNLPFVYKGIFSIDGKTRAYEINASSFFSINYRDTSVYFGCNSKTEYKYFLAHPFVDSSK
jgi:hypothetical protein